MKTDLTLKPFEWTGYYPTPNIVDSALHYYGIPLVERSLEILTESEFIPRYVNRSESIISLPGNDPITPEDYRKYFTSKNSTPVVHYYVLNRDWKRVIEMISDLFGDYLHITSYEKNQITVTFLVGLDVTKDFPEERELLNQFVGRYFTSPLRILNELVSAEIPIVNWGTYEKVIENPDDFHVNEAGIEFFDKKETNFPSESEDYGSFEDPIRGQFNIYMSVTVRPEDYEKARDLFIGRGEMAVYGEDEPNATFFIVI